MSDDRLLLIYEEARRTSEHQVAALDQLRGRATGLFAVAAIVAGFLGPEGFDSAADRPWELTIGLLAFLTVAAAAIFTLVPRPGWNPGNSTSELIATYIQFGRDLDYARRELALRAESMQRGNKKYLEQVLAGLTVSCIALALEVISLLLAVR